MSNENTRVLTEYKEKIINKKMDEVLRIMSAQFKKYKLKRQY